MASDHPIIPNSLSNGSRRRSQSHQTRSRRSSASKASSKAGRSTEEDIPEEAEPSKRGRKPFEVSEEVDRGLLRVLDSTDVSFDKLAKAVEESGGPRKLWLRRRFKGITGTNCFGLLRLGNHRESAIQRRRWQQEAMGLPVAEPPPRRGFQVQRISASTTFPAESTTVSQLTRPESNSTDTASTRDRTVDERPSSFDFGSAMSDAEHDDHREYQIHTSMARSTLASRSTTAPTLTKRAFSDEADGVSRPSYITRKDRTRALSLSAIIETLENMTGQTGLYDHIKRISVKSHISPRFRTARFSRGSRRASEASTAPGNSTYEPNSPRGMEAGPIPYDPDPDYKNYYHDPSSDQMAQLQPLGAGAVAFLMSARASSMSDEEAESHLLKALPDDMRVVASFVNTADDKGITALHLAVAYGYPRVCRCLMQSLASPFAITNRGSSVCQFARPAQDFAKELALYHRILHCRQWICAGLMPPVPADLDTDESPDNEEGIKPRQTPKRIKTIDTSSTLGTVQETPIEEAVGTEDIPLRSSTTLDRNTSLTPLITGYDIRMGHSTFGQSLGRPISDYDSSPVSVRQCLRDHDNIGNLLTPDSFSPNGPFWPGEAAPFASQMGHVSTALQSSSQPVEPTTQQWDSFGGLNIMTSLGPNGLIRPLASFPAQYHETSQVSSGSNFVSNTVMPFDWSATGLQHTGQILTGPSYLPTASTMPANFERSQDRSYGYQEQYDRQAPSRLQYPTPPSESRPMRQQEPWRLDGDVSRATALALSDQTSFPSEFWYDDDNVASTNNHNSFYHHSSSYTFDPNV